MKKKIIMLLALCMTALLLGACGKDPTTEVYNGVSYRELQEVSSQTIASLSEITQEDRDYFVQAGATEVVALIDKWNEVTKDLGSYQGCGDFSVAKAGNTLTTDMIVQFEKRNVNVQFVYRYHDMAQTGFTIEPVYTLGEKMSKAGLNTVISLLVVFTVLILICLIICAFNIFPYLEKRKEAKKQPAAEEPSEEAAISQTAQPEELVDDLELVAVIAAAIAAATGASADGFVVRSIRRR